MEMPRCLRCAKKNVSCVYPNNKGVETIIPELEFPWLDDLFRDPNTIPWEGALQSRIDAASTTAYSISSDYDGHMIRLAEPDYLLNVEVPKSSTLAPSETEAAVRRFKSWPEKWVKEGKAPFIHPRLYTGSMPKSLQDAYAACAIYATKTDQNCSVAFMVIESKANELLQSPDQTSWAPLDLLAAVQALLIFQFIRLFDGDVRQRYLAEQAAPILDAWATQLSTRTTDVRGYTTDTAPSWRSWVFAESVRRTTIMSVFLIGVYSMVKKGYCTMGDRVTALSFTAQRKLWDTTGPLEWERAKQDYNPFWTPRMNFDHVMRHAKGDDLDDFGMVLLIAYKGQDAVNHWVTTELRRILVTNVDFSQSLIDMVQREESTSPPPHESY